LRITNMETLISHANIRGRELAAQILDAGLDAANPYNNSRRLLRVENNKLIVGNDDFELLGDPQKGEELYDLDQLGKIYVFGAGKGVQYVAKAIEDALGQRLTGGHVIDKKGCAIILKKIGVTLGGHPLPDEDCILGCQKIIAIAQGLKENDLVFTIAGNGISSLLTLPLPGISLGDLQKITHILQIERGAPTIDLCPIRNHLDLMKGGRISTYFQPAKMIHILAIPPENYNSLMHNNFWLHTLPDSTTFEDARKMIEKWEAWDELPFSVTRHLAAANPKYETPKAKDFAQMSFRIFGVMPEKLGVLQMAQKKAVELGLKPVVLAKDLQAEASQIGIMLATIAKTVTETKMPFTTPCAIFTTGEVVVTVGKEQGIGGRNQEVVLSAALKIAGSKNIVIGAVDTDGTDGPGTQLYQTRENIPCLAGGIVDGDTMSEARQMGIDLSEELKYHNSTPALWKLKSGVLATQNISLGDLTVTVVMD
jgi:glycerate 2-kinase